MAKSTKKLFDILDPELDATFDQGTKDEEALEASFCETTQATVVRDEADAQGIPFEVWFHLKKLKAHWMQPMQAFAKEKGLKTASISGWDELFKSY